MKFADLIIPTSPAPLPDEEVGKPWPNAVLKWGEALNAGYQYVPDILLHVQGSLKLSAVDVVVLLNLMAAWWSPDRPPFPRPSTIAKRMGTGIRTVQRSLVKLERKGLIIRRPIIATAKDGKRYAYELEPLARALLGPAKAHHSYRDRIGRTVAALGSVSERVG